MPSKCAYSLFKMLVSCRHGRGGRALRILIAGTLAMAASTAVFGQATITRLSPSWLQVGSKNTEITVYGNNFESPQKVYVKCAGEPVLLKRETKGKEFYVTIKIEPQFLEMQGAISISVEPCVNNVPPTGSVSIIVDKFKDMAPYGGAVVGVDVSAASSVSPAANFLGLGVVDFPLHSQVQITDRPNHGVVWVSGQLGLKGMAQPGAISNAASAGYYATAVNATPDKIVQSIDASLHVGVQLWAWTNDIGTFDVKGSDSNGFTHTGTTTTMSLIFGGGAVTPLSVSQSSPQVFEATPLIIQNETPVAPVTAFAPSCGMNPSQTPTCFVIFVPSDRTHFYRDYDFGIRLKLYGNDNQDHELRFPAILDLTLGQNEYVTGGKFNGAVLHLGGTLPIPRADSFYIFGSIDMGLSQNDGGGAQLQLIPAPVTTGLTASSPSVYTIVTSQPNRDRYQFGFGMDVFHFFTSLHDKKKPGSGD